MKDVRFYLEFPDRKTKKRSGREHKGHSGTVAALFVYEGMDRMQPEGLAALFSRPDSPVASTGFSWEYLYEKGKRIPEALARKIHPKLFERLDV